VELVQLATNVFVVELPQGAHSGTEGLKVLVSESRRLILISTLLCSLQRCCHLFVDGVVPSEGFSEADRLKFINAPLQQSGGIVDGSFFRLVAFPLSHRIGRARLMKRRFRGRDLGGSLQKLGRHAACLSARALSIGEKQCLQLRPEVTWARGLLVLRGLQPRPTVLQEPCEGVTEAMYGDHEALLSTHLRQIPTHILHSQHLAEVFGKETEDSPNAIGILWIGHHVPLMVFGCLRVLARAGACQDHALDADVGTRELDHLTLSIRQV
jgi:hypothetical protein